VARRREGEGCRGSAWRQAVARGRAAPEGGRGHDRGVPEGGRGARRREDEGCLGTAWLWVAALCLNSISDGVFQS
jgi:hypothetical protein